MIGAHVSIAGGVDRAPERGRAIGCEAIQIFTRNQRRWRSPPLDKQAGARFRLALAPSGIRSAIGHDSYLINLASPDRSIRSRSVRAFIDEHDRAEALGLDALAFHPGSHGGRGARDGIKRAVDSLNTITSRRPRGRVRLLIESTAGQGASLGSRFEEIAEIMAGVEDRKRFGVCLDTCHIFAAGYDLRTRRAYRRTIQELDSLIGLRQVGAIHMNDSRGELGSRIDRHEHIGRGRIGAEAFRMIVNDPRFGGIPKILETPGDQASFARNLRMLRRMIRTGRSRGGPTHPSAS